MITFLQILSKNPLNVIITILLILPLPNQIKSQRAGMTMDSSSGLEV